MTRPPRWSRPRVRRIGACAAATGVRAPAARANVPRVIAGGRFEASDATIRVHLNGAGIRGLEHDARAGRPVSVVVFDVGKFAVVD